MDQLLCALYKGYLLVAESWEFWPRIGAVSVSVFIISCGGKLMPHAKEEILNSLVDTQQYEG